VHFPQVNYEKMGLQEMGFQEAFDGVICIDAMEHVSPENYPHVLQKFQEALKAGGVLYFTMDREDPRELKEAYERAKAKGLPVVLGEVVDEVDEAITQVKELGQTVSLTLADAAVYHFYPSSIKHINGSKELVLPLKRKVWQWISPIHGKEGSLGTSRNSRLSYY